MKKLIIAAALSTCAFSSMAQGVVLDDVGVYANSSVKLDVWASAYNAYGYCHVNGFDDAIGFTTKCGEDESTFARYAGGTKWVQKDSGSKNQCYALLETVTCVNY
ncbi:hypothetical protein [Pseudoalteromonas rubra]|uniref:Uncharacterized protein n=1 Tax=Pseudoalteromonas rubra TaxID=43658 RepID=A0A5S3X6I8_9GAMM|nr:hypothetical protein [Pseudoalteromonas rubra]TMP39555.1 hypothetical protein CWB98_02910 [Pseudoalteromonas rubra]